LPDDQEIPLNKIPGTREGAILTYPSLNEGELKSRLKELSAIGVTAIRFTGHTQIGGVNVLGKGCVGLVAQATLDGAPVALKIRRLDANRPSMKEEARLLRLANSVGVGPTLLVATRNFLAMQFLEGLPLLRWSERAVAKRMVRNVLRALLFACFRLDAVGLDHGELSHAPKNIIVSPKGGPFILDFESASMSRRPANVTSLLQYFLFGQLSGRIRHTNLVQDKREVLGSLTKYKMEPSVGNFQDILLALRL